MIVDSGGVLVVLIVAADVVLVVVLVIGFCRCSCCSRSCRSCCLSLSSMLVRILLRRREAKQTAVDC